MIDLLRAKTRDLHDQVEEVLFSNKIKVGEITNEELSVLVATNAEFYAVCKQKCSGLLFPFIGRLFQETDYQPEAHSSTSYTSRTEASRFPIHEESLGWLYVLIGSSLGSNYISGRLKMLNHVDEDYTSFFGKRAALNKYWPMLQQELSSSTNSAEPVVKGAIDAFEFLIAKGKELKSSSNARHKKPHSQRA